MSRRCVLYVNMCVLFGVVGWGAAGVRSWVEMAARSTPVNLRAYLMPLLALCRTQPAPEEGEEEDGMPRALSNTSPRMQPRTAAIRAYIELGRLEMKSKVGVGGVAGDCPLLMSRAGTDWVWAGGGGAL